MSVYHFYCTRTALLSFLANIIIQCASGAPQQDSLLCGIPKINQTDLIIRGKDTTPGEWPWHVAIYHRIYYSNKYVCGGTLITESFVLTAAHCVQKKKLPISVKLIFVRMGAYDLSEWHSKEQQHSIQRIHVPENPTHHRLTCDIALLELSTVVEFNEYIQPACLIEKLDLTGEYGLAIGWGLSENDEATYRLKNVLMPVVSAIRCLESDRLFFGHTLTEDVFCAGYTNGTAVCNGDSGGGLFFQQGNAWFIGGIVSFSQYEPNSNRCNPHGYGAFMKVFSYLHWIKEITHYEHHTDEDATRGDDRREGNFVSYFPKYCGVTKRERLADNTTFFQWPWIAQVVEKRNETDTFCSGSLINSRYVLTSATCALYKPYRVILGMHQCETSYNRCQPPVQQYFIKSILVHQEFNRLALKNDIALIRLTRDVQFEDHIQPVCLPVTPKLRQSRHPKYSVSVFSDGRYHQNSTLSEQSRSECQKRNATLDYRQLCMASGGFYKGNNGAPLGYVDYLGGPRFIQFGIASYPASTDMNFGPTVFTKVAAYINWIVENTNKNVW
ncbi:ovochymase-2-like [Armigeres subalbatus]|uniref:ovochymase-2-like n=1 Tax=Armigeres subalbatus TaxID=124917 RepID=UPI002ED23EB1